MLRRITYSGLPLASLCIGLASPTQALAEGPAIHVGSDTRAKSRDECMTAAKFAIGETGLHVSFTADPHIGGTGVLMGADVSVMVTCLSLGPRTFIEVIGTSLNSGAAAEARNRVRTIVMGPPT